MDGADGGSTLPRGRHNLPPGEVARSQRTRLMHAVIEEVAVGGLSSATVSAVVKRARVSREAFYVHYPNLAQCYALAVEGRVQGMRDALAASGDHDVSGVLRELLAHVDEDLPAARCLFLQPGRPPATDAVTESLRPALREALPGAPDFDLAAIGRVVVSVVADALEAGTTSVADLHAPLVAFVAAHRGG